MLSSKQRENGANQRVGRRVTSTMAAEGGGYHSSTPLPGTAPGGDPTPLTATVLRKTGQFDALSCTRVDLSSSSLKSIAGLGALPNLTALSLADNPVSVAETVLASDALGHGAAAGSHAGIFPL